MGEATFGTAQLGDPRRTRRAVAIAEALARARRFVAPATASSSGVGSRLSFSAFAGELRSPAAAACEHTREEMGQVERVLFIQDTTEVDYRRHPPPRDWDRLALAAVAAFCSSSVLAVVQGRQVLGAHQEPFLRVPAPPETEVAACPARPRKSQSGRRSVVPSGVSPARTQWIHVETAPAICFHSCEPVWSQDCDFVVRASADRCVDLLVEQAERPVAPRPRP